MNNHKLYDQAEEKEVVKEFAEATADEIGFTKFLEEAIENKKKSWMERKTWVTIPGKIKKASFKLDGTSISPTRVVNLKEGKFAERYAKLLNEVLFGDISKGTIENMMPIIMIASLIHTHGEAIPVNSGSSQVYLKTTVKVLNEFFNANKAVILDIVKIFEQTSAEQLASAMAK